MELRKNRSPIGGQVREMSATRKTGWSFLVGSIVVVLLVKEVRPTSKSSEGAPFFINKRQFECFERIQSQEGATVELRCDADGNPKPNVTWTKFGDAIHEGATVNFTEWSVVLRNLTDGDAGLYECEVCNSVGCVKFQYLLETHGYKSSFAVIGTKYVIQPDIEGNNTRWLRITHHRNCFAFISDKNVSEMLSPDENNRLTYERIAYADSGLYLCTSGSQYFLEDLRVVSNGNEYEVHREHSFLVKQTGDMIAFECIWNNVNVTWSKNGASLENHTYSSFELKNLSHDDGGLYRCEICHRAGCRDYRFLLVIDTIFKEDSMQNISSRYHDSVWLYCRTIFSDFNIEHSISYVTFTNGKKLHVNTEIVQIRPVMAGWCSCVVNSVYGKHTKTANIQLPHYGKPMFKRDWKMTMYFKQTEGNTVNISCAVTEKTKPNITWIKDGELYENEIRATADDDTYSIRIENLTKYDSGEYSCKLCNSIGCNNRTYWILVRPSLNKTTQTTTATVNSEAYFTCLEKNYPFIKNIEWKKIDVGNPISVFPSLQYAKEFNVLHFQNVKHSDAGIYLCKVTFYAGEDYEITFSLLVADHVSGSSDEYMSIPTSISYIAAFCSLLLIMLVIGKKYICRKQRKIIKKVTILHQLPENSLEIPDTIHVPTVQIELHRSKSSKKCDLDLEYDLPVDTNWEFPRDKLVLGPNLGQGAFGKVVLAEAHGVIPDATDPTTVAVKMLKLNHTDSDMKDFVCEMEIMKMIGRHPNIINLLGCCCANGPLYVIVEYAPHGNLKSFLREHRPDDDYETDGLMDESNTLSVNQLTNFTLQIAHGMEYLASRKCVHRDLAARNILVSTGYAMKISDFGLARDILDYEYYRMVAPGKLPIRWTAPESMENRVYTSRSDVWSFGVLTWEIMTLGDQPYKDWENLFDQLKRGRRLDQPELCPDEMFQLMNGCWQFMVERRPTFSEIVRELHEMIESEAEYASVDNLNFESTDKNDILE